MPAVGLIYVPAINKDAVPVVSVATMNIALGRLADRRHQAVVFGKRLQIAGGRLAEGAITPRQMLKKCFDQVGCRDNPDQFAVVANNGQGVKFRGT